MQTCMGLLQCKNVYVCVPCVGEWNSCLFNMCEMVEYIEQFTC